MRNGPIAGIALATLCFASIAAERDAPAPVQAAIARVWHGRVALARAAEYERYIAPQLKAFRKIAGNRGYTLLKEARGDEMHFLVISYWDSRSAIRAYAGEDITKVHALPRDPEFLRDPEQTVMNYEIVVRDFD
jgi:heme-degrading monooxygenase HmoA